jgi:hypothetical protein
MVPSLLEKVDQGGLQKFVATCCIQSPTARMVIHWPRFPQGPYSKIKLRRRTTRICPQRMWMLRRPDESPSWTCNTPGYKDQPFVFTARLIL